MPAGTQKMANRVGDWSGISLDPSSPNTFWAGNELGANFWSTWLAKFQVGSSTSGGNQAPTVATPASASPNPVAGTTTNLSVLGADDTGESGKSGPAKPEPFDLATVNGKLAALDGR